MKGIQRLDYCASRQHSFALKYFSCVQFMSYAVAAAASENSRKNGQTNSSRRPRVVCAIFPQCKAVNHYGQCLTSMRKSLCVCMCVSVYVLVWVPTPSVGVADASARARECACALILTATAVAARLQFFCL